MSTPAEFEKELIGFGLTAKKNAVMAVRKAFISIARGVITETPVDRGEAVSSWIGSIGSPASGTRDPFFPGKKGSTAAANRQGALDEAKAIADSYTDSEAGLHLVNNTRQIGFLNAGSSKQAPALFVEAAVAKGAEAAKLVKVLD